MAKRSKIVANERRKATVARYAERRRWNVEIISASEGEHGGYREIVARIEGKGSGRSSKPRISSAKSSNSCGSGRSGVPALRASRRPSGVRRKRAESVRSGPPVACSSSAHVASEELALSLRARNLALAEAAGLDEILAPCAACFSRLASASVELADNPQKCQAVSEVVGMPYSGGVKVLNMLAVLERLPEAQSIYDEAKTKFEGRPAELSFLRLARDWVPGFREERSVS